MGLLGKLGVGRSVFLAILLLGAMLCAAAWPLACAIHECCR